MKKVIKKKLEETKQHAFEKKVLQREKAKGAPRVGEFYKENDILLEDIDLGQIRIDMKREGEDITTEEIIERDEYVSSVPEYPASPTSIFGYASNLNCRLIARKPTRNAATKPITQAATSFQISATFFFFKMP